MRFTEGYRHNSRTAPPSGENLVDADLVIAVGLQPGELPREVAGAHGSWRQWLVVGDDFVVAQGHEARFSRAGQPGSGDEKGGKQGTDQKRHSITRLAKVRPSRSPS